MIEFLTKAALGASALISLAAPAHAAQIIGGSDLLTAPRAAQMEAWLTGDPQLAYSGALIFTNIFDKGAADTSVEFHAAVDDKGPTFFVVEATDDAGGAMQIIGGYNPVSWMVSGGFVATPNVADRIAFIFNLISATTLHQSHTSDGVYQSYNDVSYGPSMGGGLDIRVLGDLSSGNAYPYSYCLNPAAACVGGANVLGSTGLQSVTYGALEVFTISAAEVPIPAAAPLLLGALGLTGWVARRRKS